jgi:hypothetical protein
MIQSCAARHRKKSLKWCAPPGAKEVHMRISSPPTTHSCFYGIDTPEQDQLMAHKFSVDDIAKKIGVDTLAYISVDGLYRAVGSKNPAMPKPRNIAMRVSPGTIRLNCSTRSTTAATTPASVTVVAGTPGANHVHDIFYLVTGSRGPGHGRVARHWRGGGR